jgi:hypothetical protein
MKKISCAGYRFPPEVIDHAIWLYLRFTLSFRDVEDLLAERGIAVSYETVRRWVNHFGPADEDTPGPDVDLTPPWGGVSTVTNYDLAFYQRVREEYEARWGEPGFDERKLLDMIGGCARRRMLRDRTDLTPEQTKLLQDVIDNERADLWSVPQRA